MAQTKYVGTNTYKRLTKGAPALSLSQVDLAYGPIDLPHDRQKEDRRTIEIGE